MQEIIIIAAMAENRVIGKNNSMPWSFKEDLVHFHQLTKSWPCIMGRKTWESLPKKPLAGRLNIVVSSSSALKTALCSLDVIVSPTLSGALDHCAGYEKIFICGGENIYRQAMPLAHKIELTLIHGQYEGDTFFPEIDPAFWSIDNTVSFDNFSFITYSKNTKEIT